MAPEKKSGKKEPEIKSFKNLKENIMILDELKNNLIAQIMKELIGNGEEGLKTIVEALFNTAMKNDYKQELVD